MTDSAKGPARRSYVDPPELAHMDPQFRLGYRQGREDEQADMRKMTVLYLNPEACEAFKLAWNDLARDHAVRRLELVAGDTGPLTGHSPLSQKEAVGLFGELLRLRSMIAGHHNGFVPAMRALNAEADAIRAAGNDGRTWPYDNKFWEGLDGG